MRKVFLDELPKKMRAGKETIDWKNSIGYKIPFIYEEIEDELEIVEYKSGKRGKQSGVIIKYKDNTFWNRPISTSNLSNGQLGYYLNKRTGEFKYELNYHVKDDRRDMVITNREYRKIYKEKGSKYEKEKWYKYTCNKCGWTEGWIREGHLNRGIGCSCCCNASRLVVDELNSIWVTDRWMCDLGVSEEDAKRYTKSSGKTIEVTCPDCGNKKTTPVYRVYQHKSIFCNCGDGVSYPEKVIGSLLKQSGVDFYTQLSKSTFKWCGKYRYDFYIPKYNMIIETHGKQHYIDKTNFKKSLAEVKKRDEEKLQLAKENGIDNYIVLDCRYSELDWIKNSVSNSELCRFLNLQNIDWNECNTYATSNTVKRVCEYWKNKNEEETTFDIAMIFNLNRGTIINYLKRGTELGWCDYDSKEESRKSASRNGSLKGKKCAAYDADGNLIVKEFSAKKLSEKMSDMFNMKFCLSSICCVCRGEKESYKGFKFRFL